MSRPKNVGVAKLDEEPHGPFPFTLQLGIPFTIDLSALANAFRRPTNTGIIRVTQIEAAIDLIKDYVEKQKKP